MDKKKAYKLAAALESGKYKQCHGFLKTKNGEYCCLGVACEIFNVTPTSRFKMRDKVVIEFEGSSEGIVSSNAQSRTGIFSNTGDFYKPIVVKRTNGKNERFYHLAQMNDEGLSFKFIAKILRKHYKNII